MKHSGQKKEDILLKSWEGIVKKTGTEGITLDLKATSPYCIDSTTVFRLGDFKYVFPPIGKRFAVEIWSQKRIVIKPLDGNDDSPKTINELMDILNQIA